MKLMALVFLAAFTISLGSSYAQDKAQVSQPKTKLEAFEAQQGMVIIRGFSKIGQIHGIYGNSVVVESMEITNATSTKKEYGITIDAQETGGLKRNSRAFVDYDEIESLMKGMDYISKVDKSATKLDNFQVDYKTKGDLNIAVFSTGREILGSISIGRIGAIQVFLKVADLAKFRELIVKAKDKLDPIRKS